MVIVRLWGGLGNQMFQYACGYAAAKKNNTELMLDTRFFSEDFLKKNKHFSRQKANLLQFPLDFTTRINEDNSLKIIGLLQNRTISRIIRIPPKFNILVEDNLLYCKETRLTYLPYIFETTKSIYLDGYWQCEKYFHGFKADIIRQFTRNSKTAKTYAERLGILNDRSVAVHLRLGDYSSSKIKVARYNSIVDPQYYIEAMKNMQTRINKPIFFVFSNDIEKAKGLLSRYNCCFVNESRELDDLDEFEVMSLCQNHIISNSTFSWWAAWLSDETGYTIAPDHIAGNDMIIPETWTKLHVGN